MPRTLAADPVRLPALAALPALSALLWCGCESAAVETTTRQMDSASDVALLCALETRHEDGTTTWAGTTMDQCAKDLDGDLFAFVVQRYRGELAAVNLRDRRLLDLDLRQPLSSPVVVGPLPNAIAAAPDGSSLAVANLGDPRPGDDPTNPDGVPFLSIVNPANLLPRISLDAGRPFLSRVPLPVPASNVAYLDATHVVVTLPGLSAVAVVTLGETPVVGPPVVLDPFPLLDPEGDPLPGLGVPWSILVDDVRGRLVVGDRAAPWLAVLTWDDAFALTVAAHAPDPFQLPGPSVAMAIEPPGRGPAGDEPGRWIYAVDGSSRGVMVLDAETLAAIDMSTGDPLEWRNELIVPGLAQDVLLGRIAQDPVPDPADPEPEVMHGTFGFVVSSFGEVFAVDVEDHGNAACWDGAAAGEGSYVESACPRHVLRNGIAGAEGPRWSDEPPSLFQASGAALSYSGAPPDEYPRFHDFGGETAEGDPTWGVLFDTVHPRRAVSQTWIVEYEGVVPWTDGNGGQVGDAGWFRDRAMPFCARGVLAGDILIIKDGPDPLSEATDCSAWGAVGQEAELEYRIVEARADRLLLETVVGADGNTDPLPTRECFPWAVRYEVRVGGRWLVRGEATGFQHHVTVGEDPDPTDDVPGLCIEFPDDAICTPYENCTTEPVDVRCLHDGRATDGVIHKNPFLCFTMDAGTVATPRGMRWELDATGGFAALSVETGSLPVAEALDVTTGTGPALLVVDSSSDGLIRVDLADFTVSDNWP
ncbi:MAG: hypothetical protein HY907_04240 [Deltaproteobacteria bacterium]|nr:hypothetical protein [Deltaproteobacteria bacterium]